MSPTVFPSVYIQIRLGRLDKTHPPPMRPPVPVLGNVPLPTGEKTPRCS